MKNTLVRIMLQTQSTFGARRHLSIAYLFLSVSVCFSVHKSMFCPSLILDKITQSTYLTHTDTLKHMYLSPKNVKK